MAGRGYTWDDFATWAPYPDRPEGSDARIKPSAQWAYICSVFRRDDPIIEALSAATSQRVLRSPWNESEDGLTLVRVAPRLRIIPRLMAGMRGKVSEEVWHHYRGRGMVKMAEAVRYDLYRSDRHSQVRTDPLAREWNHRMGRSEPTLVRRWVEDGRLRSERPVEVHRDGDGRVHCETGPALVFRSGAVVYALQGLAVPEHWVMDRESITVDEVFGQKSAELRRVGCELIGWESVLRSIDAFMVDDDGDPLIGTLYEGLLPGAPDSCGFLKVLCGTGRTFVIPVPPGLGTAMAAQAWLHDLRPVDWEKPEVRG